MCNSLVTVMLEPPSYVPRRVIIIEKFFVHLD